MTRANEKIASIFTPCWKCSYFPYLLVIWKCEDETNEQAMELDFNAVIILCATDDFVSMFDHSIFCTLIRSVALMVDFKAEEVWNRLCRSSKMFFTSMLFRCFFYLRPEMHEIANVVDIVTLIMNDTISFLCSFATRRRYFEYDLQSIELQEVLFLFSEHYWYAPDYERRRVDALSSRLLICCCFFFFSFTVYFDSIFAFIKADGVMRHTSDDKRRKKRIGWDSDAVNLWTDRILPDRCARLSFVFFSFFGNPKYSTHTLPIITFGYWNRLIIFSNFILFRFHFVFLLVFSLHQHWRDRQHYWWESKTMKSWTFFTLSIEMNWSEKKIWNRKLTSEKTGRNMTELKRCDEAEIISNWHWKYSCIFASKHFAIRLHPVQWKWVF